MKGKLEILVKENSLIGFLSNRMVDYNVDNFKRQSCDGNVNPYYLMKDIIYIKKDEDLTVNQHIIFELEDESKQTKSKLINRYTYSIKEYDDVSYQLLLIDFKVNIN